jgi:hypothetical protein
MKKVLVFLLTLSFVASAYALDLGNGLTIDGEVKTGLGVFTEDDGVDTTDDTLLGGWNDDAGKAIRIRTAFTYATDLGGIKIRMESLGAAFDPAKAFGWANFLDKKVVVHGGKGIDDLWGLGKLSENVFDPNVDGVNGVRVAFNLIDGLGFGIALPMEAYNPDSTSTNPQTAQPVGDVFSSSVFAGLYTSPLVSGAFGVKLNPSKEDLSASPTYSYDAWTRIILGVEVNPISGLLIILDADIDTRKYQDSDGVQVGEKNGYVRIGPLFQYSTGKLTAHLKGDIAIQNDGYGNLKGENIADFIGAYGSSNYDDFIGNHALYVPVENVGDPSIAFEIGAGYNITDNVNAYFNLGSDNIMWLKGDGDKGLPGNGIFAKPGVKITLGNASIEIFDKINGIGTAKLTQGPGLDDISFLTNQFQIDLNWVF